MRKVKRDSLRGHKRSESTSSHTHFMFNMHYRKILKGEVLFGWVFFFPHTAEN